MCCHPQEDVLMVWHVQTNRKTAVPVEAPLEFLRTCACGWSARNGEKGTRVPRVPYPESPSTKGKAPCSRTFERRGAHRPGHSPFSFENPFTRLFWGSRIIWTFSPLTARSPPALLPTPLHLSECQSLVGPSRIVGRFPGASLTPVASSVCLRASTVYVL